MDHPAAGGRIAGPDWSMAAASLVVLLLPAAIVFVAAPVVFFPAAAVLVLTHASEVLLAAEVVLAPSVVICHGLLLSWSAGIRGAHGRAGRIGVMTGDGVNGKRWKESRRGRINLWDRKGIGHVALAIDESDRGSWSSRDDACVSRRIGALCDLAQGSPNPLGSGVGWRDHEDSVKAVPEVVVDGWPEGRARAPCGVWQWRRSRG